MNNMKCPFCNQKLESIGTSGQFQCGTWGCEASFNFIATRDVWEYIDKTRKALEIARIFIEKVRNNEDTNIFWIKVANNTINEITALTKGGDNE